MEEKATQTPEKTFSMEQALQETEARLEKRVRPGQVLTGKVVLVGSEGVAVDIGAKTEGIIPFNQLTEKPLSEEELKGLLKPGDEVRVQVLRVDPETGQILLSRKKVEATEHWDRIQELYEKGEPVTVTVKEKVKGGRGRRAGRRTGLYPRFPAGPEAHPQPGRLRGPAAPGQDH
jgi:small subunit ribosomal protein S1